MYLKTKHETRKLNIQRRWSKIIKIKSIKNQTCHIISIIHKLYLYKCGTRGISSFEYFWNGSLYKCNADTYVYIYIYIYIYFCMDTGIFTSLPQFTAMLLYYFFISDV